MVHEEYKYDSKKLVCKSSANSIKSFGDGSTYKKHGFFNKTKYSLCLKFYKDDFEPANTLGEMKGGYKLTGVYYQIMNLDTATQSKLQSIL
jgi:hypothetical protein